jgi:hypothetical protein
VSDAAATPHLRASRGHRWPGPLRRLWVHLMATSLDRALAEGAQPCESVDLSLRAGQLVGERQREQIATSIRALLDLAGQDLRIFLGLTRLPVERERIEANRTQLEGIAEILLGPGPVAPRGVAMARRLVTDFRGPIYTGGRNSRLPEALSAIQSALAR